MSIFKKKTKEDYYSQTEIEAIQDMVCETKQMLIETYLAVRLGLNISMLRDKYIGRNEISI